MNYLFLELYKVGNQVHGSFIESSHFTNLQREYGRMFKLPGEKVTQFFVIVDTTITNQDATEFIERIEKGRVTYRHIDLSSVSNPRVKKNAR